MVLSQVSHGVSELWRALHTPILGTARKEHFLYKLLIILGHTCKYLELAYVRLQYIFILKRQ